MKYDECVTSYVDPNVFSVFNLFLQIIFSMTAMDMCCALIH